MTAAGCLLYRHTQVRTASADIPGNARFNPPPVDGTCAQVVIV